MHNLQPQVPSLQPLCPKASAALHSTREALQGSEAALAATRLLVTEHERQLDEQGVALREALSRGDAAMAEREEMQARLIAARL